jgi:hypothetical protein
VDLFRSGNATSACLDRVRLSPPHLVPDVDHQIDGLGRIWVEANGEGMSSHEAIQASWSGKPWHLPKGSYYSTSLTLISDVPGHWHWCPVTQMLLDDYKTALSTVNALFQRVANQGLTP